VTHKGCLDGTGSALVFWWAGGKTENILFRNPSTCALSPIEAAPYDEIWYADVCPSGDDPGGGKPFHVFDHHVSNQKKHPDDERYTFDLSKSGTSLLAYELGFELNGFNKWEQRLVEALEAYDLGRFDHVEGQMLADVAATYTQEDLLWLLQKFGPDFLDDKEMKSRAEALAAVRNLYAANAAKYCRREDFFFQGICVTLGIATSPVYWKNAVAQEILRMPDAPQVAVIFDPTSQMVSLRSLRGGPDCSMIAGLYGGGGHAQAAGFKFSGQAMLASLTRTVFG